MHPFILHTLVFDHCLVGNPDLLNNNLPAGIPITVGECIMWFSGECEVETLASDIDQARGGYVADSVKEVMKHVIYLAWPGYVEEDLAKLTYPELIKRFVVAEHLLMKKAAREGAEYQPFDTRKIRKPGEKKKAIDFKKENQEMHQALGERTHALDQTPGEFDAMRQRNKGKLSRTLARKLDQRQRTRG